VISDCDFENNDSDNEGGAGILCDLSSVTISSSRFFDNFGFDGAALMCRTGSTVTVTNCTFADNDGPVPGGSQVHVYSPAQVALENTIIAFGMGEAVTCGGGGSATLACSDLFGNQGGDWTGCIAGQLGVDGNFSADPIFCDLLAGDLTLNNSSPCLPGHHPQGENCGLIGAFGQGCGPTAVDPDEATWGRIKAAFPR
jgi:hypothetical protein